MFRKEIYSQVRLSEHSYSTAYYTIYENNQTVYLDIILSCVNYFRYIIPKKKNK